MGVKFLKDNDIEMCSTYNKGKSVVAEDLSKLIKHGKKTMRSLTNFSRVVTSLCPNYIFGILNLKNILPVVHLQSLKKEFKNF